VSELFYVPTDGPPESTWVHTGSRGKYAHRFGGPPHHIGSTFSGCDRPLVLLYTIDLADPNFRLRIPGIRFLPLYNGIRYDSTPVYYRLRSDAEIEILRQERTTFTPEFPYPDYPESFPELPVSLDASEPIEFDRDIQKSWETLWYPDLPPRDPDKNELIASFGYILRGGVHECVNRNCPKSDVNTLAEFGNEWLEDQGISIWGGAQDVVIVYYICYSCFTVSSFNLVN